MSKVGHLKVKQHGILIWALFLFGFSPSCSAYAQFMSCQWDANLSNQTETFSVPLETPAATSKPFSVAITCQIPPWTSGKIPIYLNHNHDGRSTGVCLTLTGLSMTSGGWWKKAQVGCQPLPNTPSGEKISELAFSSSPNARTITFRSSGAIRAYSSAATSEEYQRWVTNVSLSLGGRTDTGINIIGVSPASQPNLTLTTQLRLVSCGFQSNSSRDIGQWSMDRDSVSVLVQVDANCGGRFDGVLRMRFRSPTGYLNTAGNGMAEGIRAQVKELRAVYNTGFPALLDPDPYGRPLEVPLERGRYLSQLWIFVELNPLRPNWAGVRPGRIDIPLAVDVTYP